MKTRVITALVMPGGWHKPEIDRAGRPLPNPIRGDTFEHLIENVTKFRTDNLIPLGNVLQDVEDFICATYPRSCGSVRGAKVSIEVSRSQPTAPTITDRMVAWLAGVLNNHSQEKLVLNTEARARAEVCRKCPLNVKWNISCGSCVEQVGRLSTAVRLGNDVPWGKKLFACKAAGHENRSAVWLRNPGPRPSNVPAHCWL